jgi:predicted nucleotidyltransferase
VGWILPSHLASFVELRDLLNDVNEDANVVAVLISGSYAHRQLSTARSDVDLHLVVSEPDPRRRRERRGALDIAVWTVDELRDVPGPSDPGWWQRYIFRRPAFLKETADGEVRRLAERWGRLTGAESKAVLESHLDGYLNSLYRSLKSARDGLALQSHLDATESLTWALPSIFAFDKRVRPYNKYLRWDLLQEPLSRPDWETERLLGWLDLIVRRGDVDAQRALFATVEQAAREVGLGDIVDSWHHELPVLRGEPAG